MTTWNSLYCPSDDTESVVRQLYDSLMHDGYELYNPFGVFPGKAYAHTVRLFVAPAAGGWVRVIGAPGDRLLTGLGTCLYAELKGANARFEVYAGGVQVDLETGLKPYLRPDCGVEDLRRALGQSHVTGTTGGSRLPDKRASLPFGALPEDVQQLAGKVDKRAAEKMFARLSGQLMNRAGQDRQAAEAAHALVAGEELPDWNSPGGQRISAIMACLTVPENWREPDFDTLRDAYPLHERRRRNPNARLYPGDAEMLAKAPDALRYTAVYGGRS